MADAIPTSRNAPSVVSVTCAIARFTGPGKAANRIPSMANTKPIATRKSDIPANRYRLLIRGFRYLGVAGGAGVRPLPCDSRGFPDGSTK